MPCSLALQPCLAFYNILLSISLNYHLLIAEFALCSGKGGTINMRGKWFILTFLVAFSLITTVSAVPIKFDTACEVTVTYLGTNAAYHNAFGWVEGIPPGTLHYLGTGHSTSPGTSWDIGPRVANVNNILYITPSETQHTYYSDPTASNSDSIEHVKVTQIDQYGYLVCVGFEDLFGGGDKDFNDIYLEVSCTPITSPKPVPEFPTMALPVVLIVGLVGTVFIIQTTREQ